MIYNPYMGSIYWLFLQTTFKIIGHMMQIWWKYVIAIQRQTKSAELMTENISRCGGQRIWVQSEKNPVETVSVSQIFVYSLPNVAHSSGAGPSYTFCLRNQPSSGTKCAYIVKASCFTCFAFFAVVAGFAVISVA